MITPGTCLLAAAVAAVLALVAARGAPRLWLGASLFGCAAALAGAVWILAGGQAWGWHGSFEIGGEPCHAQLDAVSAFFLALLAVLGGAGSAYAHEYWPGASHPRSAPSGRAWWTALLAFMALILVSANGLHFLIAWELFALSGFFLITRERHKIEVRKAGWLYLAASHAGTLCLFAFFASLAARTGSWELGPMRERSDLSPLFWLALAGFGLKAGLFPLHIWLPSAHANAPSHVSAILSGVAIKMGIYGLVRFTGWLPVPEAAGWVLAALGAVSAVLGVVFALAQHDLKRLLAYHSVENIGIILTGLGFALIAASRGHAAWGILALAGGLLHVWNHGLFKALLFLGAGSVLHATGTREMSKLGGLWRAMPWTSGCFVLGAAAISGLPPLNGFVSEWLVYLGLFEAVDSRGGAGSAAIAAAVLLAMTGALALACFVKVVGVVFLGAPRTPLALHAHECGAWMRTPMLVLAGACAAIGLAPMLIWPAIARTASAWRPEFATAQAPAPLSTLGACHAALALFAALAVLVLWRRVKRNGLTRAVTWDCGYAAPAPRMQYTAGSFAQIITDWFGWILRPQVGAQAPRGVFPARSSRSEHTPDTVLESVVEPAGRLILSLSSAVRRLQHGRLQAYILYLLAGLIALSLLVVFGGAP